MKVIEIKDLVKKYKDVIAVNEVSLDIKEGSIFGLLGPNGAGKSTIINLITSVAHKSSGEINIFGKRVEDNDLECKRKIGVVPQNLALYDDFTAYENLKFFGELYGIKKGELKSAMEEALRFVGLEAVRDKKVKTFSGGMKRRLNIGCAIIHKPALIIMDEPTVGIDPQSRNHIIEGVKKLNEEGATIIYTTHYMEEVEALCDEIAIMDRGRILAKGSNEELKSIISDKNTLAIKVSSLSDIKDEEILRINGVEGVTTEEDGTIYITSSRAVNNLDQIISAFKDLGIRINDIGYKDTTLEDVFLTLTGRRLRD